MYICAAFSCKIWNTSLPLVKMRLKTMDLFLVQFCILWISLPTLFARVLVLDNEKDPSHWYSVANDELQEALLHRNNENAAKSVILFLGDGMSVTTVTAARIFKGQLKGKNGEAEQMTFEKFPSVGLSKTYNVDAQIPDSAGTATAFLCGVKANYGTMGVSAHVTRGDCAATAVHNVTCIAELAMDEGKWAGVVTTARVTHATPGALYSRTSDRLWEADIDRPGTATAACPDIGLQLLQHPADKFRVIMGGGRQNLLPDTERDPEYPGKRGRRRDGRHVPEEWVAAHRAAGHSARYVWNLTDFQAADPETTDYLMGIFEPSHMQYDGERESDPAGEPSLTEMVDKAIRLLSKNDKGYFLLVEGARIDHAHHDNRGRRALQDTVAFDTAIAHALRLVDLKNTLIVVTADHGHADAMVSYARRGNPILGLTDYTEDTNRTGLSDVDHMPYTTYMYANGPGYVSPRPNLTQTDTQAQHYVQASAVPLSYASHDGSDVAVYATGPMSHLFHTTHEQNYIFHVMAYAACVGHNKGHCAPRHHNQDASTGTYHRASGTPLYTMLGVIVLQLFKLIQPV